MHLACYFFITKIGNTARDHFGSKREGFRQGRMRMDGQTDVVHIRTHFQRQHRFTNQLARVCADYARTQNPARSRSARILVMPSFLAILSDRPLPPHGKTPLS